MTSLITPELVLMEHRDRLAAAERARQIRYHPEGEERRGQISWLTRFFGRRRGRGERDNHNPQAWRQQHHA